MPSEEHELIVEMLAGGLGLENASIEEQRAFMEASAEMFPIDSDVIISSITVDGVPADWVSTHQSNADLIVVYLHGGAYVTGSRNTHRAIAGRIARVANARVLLPEFRLAPENPFPAAVEDILTCWRWLLSEGFSPKQVAIVGESSGGGLALATLLAIKEKGGPLPACAVALSPWTDLEATGPSAQQGTVDDPILSLEGIQSSAQLYAGSNLRNPLASPLHGELTNLPPLLIQVGTRELLLSDSTRFAEKAQNAGVDVTLEVEEGLIHGWHMYLDIPEAQKSIQGVGAFIKQHCQSM